ncbi:MAG: energy transducer TonB [Pseudomonadota bacterium]
MTRRVFYSILIACFSLTNAWGEWRCDCTQVVGSCRATVEVEGNGVSVSSNSQQCSRVDYYIDGQPFVTVAVDGKANEAWLSGTQEPRVLVQSCQVCADSLNSSSAAPSQEPEQPLLGSEDEGTVAAYLPVVKFDPIYPEGARLSGTQGYVIVKTVVGDSGRVEGVRVVESKPARVFDSAALAAVRRWRYPPRTVGADDVETQERVVFSLGRRPGNTVAATSQSRIQTPVTTGSLNACVREADASATSTGQEIQIRNVCNEALVVYSCSVGSGATSNRYQCNNTGERGTLLVAEGDGRAGRTLSQYTGRGQTKYLYAERHSIYTSKNGRFWWIACAFGDTECRQTAERWRDSLHDRSSRISAESGLTQVSRSR